MKQKLLLIKLIIVCICVLYAGSYRNGDEVRLLNGWTEYEGRVEVYHDGEWGTVCDDRWSLDAADVVCGQLGFGPAIAATGRANYGQGSGTIWLDEVICLGNESALAQCSHSRWGDHDCTHDDDAGVLCASSNNNDHSRNMDLFCHIVQLNSENLTRINDGNFSKILSPTPMSLKCYKSTYDVGNVLSSNYYNNTTIINNTTIMNNTTIINHTTSSSFYEIITAITQILLVIAAFLALCGKHIHIPSVKKTKEKKMDCMQKLRANDQTAMPKHLPSLPPLTGVTVDQNSGLVSTSPPPLMGVTDDQDSGVVSSQLNNGEDIAVSLPMQSTDSVDRVTIMHTQ